MKCVRFEHGTKLFDGESDDIQYAKKVVKYYLKNCSYLLRNSGYIRKLIPDRKMRFMVYLKLSGIKKKKEANKSHNKTKRLFTTHISKDPLYIYSEKELEIIVELLMEIVRQDMQIFL